MPKYLVTNGSNFQPFTYEELARPVQEMAQAHRESQDQYDAISMQTEALRRYISEGKGDERTKKLYDDYVEKLSNLQNNLWTYGYNAGTRRDLSVARNGFFRDMQRIGKAIQTRQESSLKWREAVKNDPSLVTSGDPGLDGLDSYLDNDLHGSEWYSYSGNKFAAEVGSEAAERSKELFGSLQEQLQVTRDPRMQGHLIYQINQGVTSKHVAGAGELVRNAVLNKNMDTKFDNSTPEGVLANVLMNHLNASNAYNNVSPEEFDRLVNKGIEGLSKAIGDSKPQITDDLVWKANQQYNNWYRQESQRRKWAKQDKEDEEKNNKNTGVIIDSRTEDIVGEGREEATGRMEKYKPNNMNTVIIQDKDGNNHEVKSGVKAAELVFSEDKAIERMKDYGFDFRTESNKFGILTPSSKQLSGEIVRNGITYEVTYKPNKSYNGEKGVVLIREKGKTKYEVSEMYTEQLKQDLKDYEDTVEWYKKNYPKLYDAAKKLNPNARRKDYEDYDTPLDFPTSGFRRRVLGYPENSAYSEQRYRVANASMGGEMFERLSGFISNGINFNEEGIPISDNQSLRNLKGTTSGIHRMNKDGKPSDDAVSPSTAFRFKDKKITNIEDIVVTPDSLLPIDKNTKNAMPGYFIVYTDDGKSYSVGTDMFESNAVSRIFYTWRDQLISYYNGEDDEFRPNEICMNLIKELWDFFGYEYPTVKGPTKEKNLN